MPRPDKDNIGKDVAEQLGLYRNFFHILRKNNPEKFAYIQRFGKDMLKAYPKFEQHRMDITNRACDIYYELEDVRGLFPFGRFLVEKGIYSHEASYYLTANTIFRPEGVSKFDSMIKLEKSNALYDEYCMGQVA